MKNTVPFAKSLLALGAVLTLAAPTLAQVPTAPAAPAAPAAPLKAGHKHVGNKQLETLGLSAQQKDQIKAIEKKGHAQVKAIKANTTLTPEQQKAKIKEVHQATRAAVMNVLTPAQKQKLAAEIKAHKGKGNKQANLRGARPAPTAPAAPATGN